MSSDLTSIKLIPAFDRDARRLKRRHYDMGKLRQAVAAIMRNDEALLATKYRDHALKGNWKGFRELHIEGDWLLIYYIDGKDLVLVLTRTGSHDELYSGRLSTKVIRGYRQ